MISFEKSGSADHVLRVLAHPVIADAPVVVVHVVVGSNESIIKSIGKYNKIVIHPNLPYVRVNTVGPQRLDVVVVPEKGRPNRAAVRKGVESRIEAPFCQSLRVGVGFIRIKYYGQSTVFEISNSGNFFFAIKTLEDKILKDSKSSGLGMFSKILKNPNKFGVQCVKDASTRSVDVNKRVSAYYTNIH